MRTVAQSCLAVLIVAAFSWSQGASAQVAGSVTLEPVTDATVRSLVPTGNDGFSQIIAVSSSYVSGYERSLVRFDQSAIDTALAGNQLVSATLEFTVATIGTSWFGGRVGAHRMLKPWTEDGATWVCADEGFLSSCSSSNRWGMDWFSWDPDPYAEDATAYAHVFASCGDTITFDVTVDVQAFLDGSESNDGWALVGTADPIAGEWVQFFSREGATPPRLVLTYEPPPDPSLQTVPVTASEDTFVSELYPDWVREGSTRLKANSDQALITKHALVSMSDGDIDIALATAGISSDDELESARLILTVRDPWPLINLGHTIDVHRMLVPWSSDRATWRCAVDSDTANVSKDCSGIAEWDMGAPDPAVRPYLPTPSSSLDAVTVFGGEMVFDVTLDVQRMLAGGIPNYGWLIRKPDQPWLGFISYFSIEGGVPPRLELTFRPKFCADGGFSDECLACFDEAGLQPSAPWPLAAQCPQNRGIAMSEGPLVYTNRWTVDLGGPSSATPAIGADGTVYLGGDTGIFHAVAADGSIKWNVATGDRIVGSAALGANDLVYFGSLDGNLHAVRATTGEPVWSRAMGSGIAASPMIGPDGTVYIGTVGGTLSALDGSTGGVVWARELFYPIRHSVAIGRNDMIFAVAGPELHGIKLYDPQSPLPAPRNLETDAVAPPVIGPNGNLHVVSDIGYWEFESSSDAFTVKRTASTYPTLLTGVRLGCGGVLLSTNTSVRLVDPETLVERWAYERADSSSVRYLLGQPAVGADNDVWVLDAARLARVSCDDGSVIMPGPEPSNPKDCPYSGSVAVANGYAVVPNDCGIDVPGRCDEGCQSGYVCAPNGRCVDQNNDTPGTTTACGDGVVTGNEACDTALSALCASDCSSTAPPLVCNDDADCPVGQLCGQNNGAAFDLSLSAGVCWPGSPADSVSGPTGCANYFVRSVSCGSADALCGPKCVDGAPAFDDAQYCQALCAAPGGACTAQQATTCNQSCDSESDCADRALRCAQGQFCDTSCMQRKECLRHDWTTVCQPFCWGDGVVTSAVPGDPDTFLPPDVTDPGAECIAPDPSCTSCSYVCQSPEYGTCQPKVGASCGSYTPGVTGSACVWECASQSEVLDATSACCTREWSCLETQTVSYPSGCTPSQPCVDSTECQVHPFSECASCLDCIADCQALASPPSNEQCPGDSCAPVAGTAPPQDHIGGLFGESEVTSEGAFAYTLQLDVPDGRLGMRPTLSLSYNSRASDGPLGPGWSVAGLSTITRCGRTIATDGVTDGVDFSSHDRFCLDGQRLVVVSGNYGAPGSEYRTELESFKKIVALGGGAVVTGFRVWTAEGLVLDYGYYGAAHSTSALVRGPRVDATGVGSNPDDGETPIVVGDVTYAWALAKVADRRGNSYRFRYELRRGSASDPRRGVEHLVKDIGYTHLDGREGEFPAQRRVTFRWEERPDESLRYVSGFGMRSTARLASIVMEAPTDNGTGSVVPREAWRYDLKYEQGSTTGRSRLARVEKCAAGTCELSAAFRWQDGVDISKPGAFERINTGYQIPSNGAGTQNVLRLMDVNGDNLADLVTARYGLSQAGLEVRLGSNTCPGGQAYCFGPLEQDLASSDVFGGKLQHTGVLQDGTLQLSRPKPGAVGVYQWKYGLGWTNMGADLPGRTVDTPPTFADVNGDGYLDAMSLLQHPGVPDPTLGIGLFEPFPSAYFPTDPSGWIDTGADACTNVFPLDTDGDGRSEFLTPRSCLDGPYRRIFLDDDGNTAVEDDFVNLDHRSDPASAWRFVDVNGDGLSDAVSFVDTVFIGAGEPSKTPIVRYNTGNGFGPEQATEDLPESLLIGFASFAAYPGVRVVDINADGREDVVCPASDSDPPIAFISDGYRLQAPNRLPSVPDDVPVVDQAADVGARNFLVTDIDGDSLVDLAYEVSGELHLFMHRGGKPDVIVGVTDGYRKEQEVEYASIADREVYTPEFTACPFYQRCLKTGMDVVKTHRMDSGVMDPSGAPIFNDYHYHYTDGRSDLNGRGFLGFSQRRVEEVERNYATTVEVYQGWVAESLPAGGYAYTYAGSPISVSKAVVDPDTGRLYATVTTNSYSTHLDATSAGTPLYRADLTGKRITEYDEDSTPFSLEEIYCPVGYQEACLFEDRFYPATSPANLTPLRFTTVAYDYNQLGQISLQEQQTHAGSSVYLDSGVPEHGQFTAISVTYLEKGGALANNWLLVPDRRTVVSNATHQRVTRYEFDDLGFLVGEEMEPDALGAPAAEELYLKTAYVRDPVLGVVDRVAHFDWDDGATPSRFVDYEYEPERIYPATTTNALGQTTRASIHPAFGKAVRVVDPNLVVRDFRYDGYGRLRRAIADHEADVTIDYMWRDLGDPLAKSEPFLVTETHEDGYSATTSYDRFARGVVARETAFDGATAISLSEYDQLGRVSHVVAPHFAGQVLDETVSSYDVLDRPRQVLESHESGTWAATTFDYLHNVHTVVDPENNQVVRLLDPDGRVARLEEPVSDSYDTQLTYRTRYTYGEFGLVKKVQDTAGNETVLDYDVRGRQSLIDAPDIGPRKMKYNAFDELVREESLRAGVQDVTVQVRDALGRLVSRTVTYDGVDDVTQFFWDRQGAYGAVGKLRESLRVTDGVRTLHGYDAYARPSHVEWQHPLATYAVDTVYDDFSRPFRVSYPAVPGRSDRYALRYDYNNQGFLESATLENADTAFQWSVQERSALGYLTRESFGPGGPETVRHFHPESNRVSTIETRFGNSSPTQSLEYHYDQNGRTVRRCDLVQGIQDGYLYDELSRLTNWSQVDGCTSDVVPVRQQTFYRYDGLGNLRSTRDTRVVAGNPVTVERNLAYGPQGFGGPHALTAAGIEGGVSALTYGYDDRGRVNQIVRNGDVALITYTPFNLPSTISGSLPGQPAASMSLTYDAFGARVSKVLNGSSRTDYAPGFYEKRVQGIDTKHVFFLRAGTRTLAQLTFDEVTASEAIDRLHDDQQGSVNSSTQMTSAVQHHYDPWGLRINADGQTSPNPFHLPAPAPETRITRGYTGHEHDDELGLINMRGRMYDPYGKHFLTPDPVAFGSLAASNSGPDAVPALEVPGPWPHGKASSAGDARFRAGSSIEAGFTPPSLANSSAITTATSPARRLPDVLGSSALGFESASTVAGSLWTNAGMSPSSQGLNPYSYVWNNPVQYIDPTGFDGVEAYLKGVGVGLTPFDAVAVDARDLDISHDPAFRAGVVFGATLGFAGDLIGIAVATVGGAAGAAPTLGGSAAAGAVAVGTLEVMAVGHVANMAVFSKGGGNTTSSDTKEVTVSEAQHPESAKHIKDAQASGKPSTVTIDRAGAKTRRAESMRGKKRTPGKDRDEYPPAMFKEGGSGSSVRPISPSDNRGAGACIGNQCRGLPDGTRVNIKVKD